MKTPRNRLLLGSRCECSWMLWLSIKNVPLSVEIMLAAAHPTFKWYILLIALPFRFATRASFRRPCCRACGNAAAPRQGQRHRDGTNCPVDLHLLRKLSI